jgi:hypothetical protein
MAATTVLCGLSAAFRASELHPMDLMKARNRGLDPLINRYTSVLVISQVALSFVLVVIGALFSSTFARLTTADLGFDRRELLLVTVDPNMPVSSGRRGCRCLSGYTRS